MYRVPGQNGTIVRRLACYSDRHQRIFYVFAARRSGALDRLPSRALTSPQPLASLIITPWYGGTQGGVAVATESLAHALLESGARCAVIRLAADGIIPQRSIGTAGEQIVDLCVRSDASARGTLLHRAGYHVRRRIAAGSLRRLIAEHDVRIAHFHYAMPGMEVLMRLAREAGLGVVTTFHGADVNSTLLDPATRPLVEEIIALSDRVTVVSRTLHERVLDAVPSVAPRLSVIHNVVPTAFARATSAAPAPAGETRWDVLLVGQLIPRKGGDVLLDALARVVRVVPDVRVALAGAGSFGTALREQAARLGVTDNVHFLGEISRDALRDAYGETRILAIPSRSEGLPLVLLESQWLGIPAVASGVDGLPEAISDGENGLLVPPEDPDALAAALIRLLTDDTLRSALGAGAARRARERFAPPVMARAFQNVYAAACADRASATRSATRSA